MQLALLPHLHTLSVADLVVMPDGHDVLVRMPALRRLRLDSCALLPGCLDQLSQLEALHIRGGMDPEIPSAAAGGTATGAGFSDDDIDDNGYYGYRSAYSDVDDCVDEYYNPTNTSQSVVGSALGLLPQLPRVRELVLSGDMRSVSDWAPLAGLSQLTSLCISPSPDRHPPEVQLPLLPGGTWAASLRQLVAPACTVLAPPDGPLAIAQHLEALGMHGSISTSISWQQKVLAWVETHPTLSYLALDCAPDNRALHAALLRRPMLKFECSDVLAQAMLTL